MSLSGLRDSLLFLGEGEEHLLERGLRDGVVLDEGGEFSPQSLQFRKQIAVPHCLVYVVV